MKSKWIILCTVLLHSICFAEYSVVRMSLPLINDMKPVESCNNSMEKLKVALNSTLKTNRVEVVSLNIASIIEYQTTPSGVDFNYPIGCLVKMELDTKDSYLLVLKKQKVKMKFLTVKERKAKIINELAKLIEDNINNKGFVYQTAQGSNLLFGIWKGALVSSLFLENRSI